MASNTTSSGGDTHDRLAAAWGAIHLAKLPALTVLEAADRLGVTPAHVEADIRAGTLVAFERDGQVVVPAFQIGAGGVLAGVAAANQALDAARDSAGALAWWLTPNPDLAPIETPGAERDEPWPTPAERIATEPDWVAELAASLDGADSF